LWWCTAPEACEPSIISERAVIAAAGLVDGYFIPMAERVLGDAAIPPSERNAMTLARYIRKSKLAEFNARDVRREVGGNLREARIMDAACLALVEAGLIRPVRGQAIGPGRKPKNFEVNMAVWKVAS
jgi:hypothetical protein